MLRKIITLLIIVSLIAAAAIVIIQHSTTVQPPNIRSTVVDRGNLTLTVNATGAVAAQQTVNLSFDTPGLVAEVLVKEGQQVQAGDILARQDDTAQKLALDEAQANLEAAQLTLQQLLSPPSEQDIAVAEAAIKAAQMAYNGLVSSVDPNTIQAAELKVKQAQTAYDDAILHRKDIGGVVSTDSLPYKLALAQEGQAGFSVRIAQLQLQLLKRGADGRLITAAKAKIAEAQARLDQLKAGVPQTQLDRAQLAIDQAKIIVDEANSDLDKTVLRAPIAGVVSTVALKPGALSITGIPGIVLTDTSHLHVDLKVDEVDIGQLQTGQSVRLTLDALPGATLTGSVDRIASLANQTTTVVSYDVNVALDPTSAPVKVGMTTSATITVRELENVLRVPNLYIRLDRRNNEAFVNLVNADGSLTEVPVQLGLRTEDYSEVVGGLNEGDKVGISLDSNFSLFGQ